MFVQYMNILNHRQCNAERSTVVKNESNVGGTENVNNAFFCEKKLQNKLV